MSDVCRKPCKDAGDVIAGMIAMVNGAAVLEYGNHLPFSVCLNQGGRLMAVMKSSLSKRTRHSCYS
jgi:hypothetical protein